MTDPDPFDVDLPDEATPVAGPTDPLFGINIGAVAAQLVGPAVKNAIGRRVDQVAGEALAAVFTPELLDQLRAEAEQVADTILHSTSPAAEDEVPELYYGSTDEFVREYLRHVYRRKIDGRTAYWSPRWWTSAEAIARLEALWRAWEHLRLDPATGPSVWWRDHADPHMRALMDPTGPFSRETDVRATVQEPLPYEAPPDGLFPDVRESRS